MMAPPISAVSDDLLHAIGCSFQRQVPLGPLTWYGIGGVAEVLARPRDADQLAGVVRLCREHHWPLRVLGKGANLLVCEGLLPGIVVRLDAFRQVTIDQASGKVTAGGGADLEQLITATVRAGLAGLEVLAGIPATVGGALQMNAGGAFGSVGPLVRRATVVEADGGVAELSADALRFSYRKSNLAGRIVTQAELALAPTQDVASLRQRLKEVMKYKKDSQPMAASSAGCAFKNPPREVSEKGAGRLIDEAGLKGLRVGGAEVSPVHANFIVVHRGGTARDVLVLMEQVQRIVEERFGIELEREVVVWRGTD